MKMIRGKWNGQTKTEYEKNFKRVKDIFDKSLGDVERAKSLSKTQANRITDEHKAINRAMAAKKESFSDPKEQEIYEAIHDVFFFRAYELGSVSKQDYREYVFEKLGI
jgi:CRISPR/Cas system CSM-associated protein Csm4 (group 5 of RAMP superfamily)